MSEPEYKAGWEGQSPKLMRSIREAGEMIARNCPSEPSQGPPISMPCVLCGEMAERRAPEGFALIAVCCDKCIERHEVQFLQGVMFGYKEAHSKFTAAVATSNSVAAETVTRNGRLLKETAALAVALCREVERRRLYESSAWILGVCLALAGFGFWILLVVR